MFALFDDAGKFLAGRVMSEADSSMQIELDSGKRVKVKAANVLLKFDKPAPAALMGAAQALAPEIELDLAWEFAPDTEFGYADLARDYFSAQATLEQQVAALLRLTDAPHYFRRAGKGRFKKAPPEILQQALAAIEKKQLVQAQIDGWTAELAAGTCPEPIRQQLYKILFKPDKNAPEYKAVVHAARETHLAPLALVMGAAANYGWHLLNNRPIEKTVEVKEVVTPPFVRVEPRPMITRPLPPPPPEPVVIPKTDAQAAPAPADSSQGLAERIMNALNSTPLMEETAPQAQPQFGCAATDCWIRSLPILPHRLPVCARWHFSRP